MRAMTAFRVVVFLVALLNLAPGVVAVRPAATAQLYGFEVTEPVLRLAMRHRAVLLACVGLALAVAAIEVSWWPAALAFAVISKVTFLALFVAEGQPVSMQRIAWADGVALLGLVLASVLRLPRGE
jgi:hypothetical protein